MLLFVLQGDQKTAKPPSKYKPSGIAKKLSLRGYREEKTRKVADPDNIRKPIILRHTFAEGTFLYWCEDQTADDLRKYAPPEVVDKLQEWHEGLVSARCLV